MLDPSYYLPHEVATCSVRLVALFEEVRESRDLVPYGSYDLESVRTDCFSASSEH